jgi:hypothetical protein
LYKYLTKVSVGEIAPIQKKPYDSIQKTQYANHYDFIQASQTQFKPTQRMSKVLKKILLPHSDAASEFLRELLLTCPRAPNKTEIYVRNA